MKNQQEIEKRIKQSIALDQQFYLMVIMAITLITIVITAWCNLNDDLQSKIVTGELCVCFATGIVWVIVCNYSKSFQKRFIIKTYSGQQKTINYLQEEIRKENLRYQENVSETIATILNFRPEEKEGIKKWAIVWFERLKKDAEETRLKIKNYLEKTDEEIVRVLQLQATVDDLENKGQEILFDFLSGVHNAISEPKYAATQLRPLIEQHALVYLKKNIDWHKERIRLVTESNKELAEFLKDRHGFIIEG